MSRTPRRYAIHLILSGGQSEVIHFASMELFQKWYQEVLHGGGSADAFVNVPISDLEGEYLLIRANAVIGIRVEPLYGLDD